MNEEKYTLQPMRKPNYFANYSVVYLTDLVSIFDKSIPSDIIDKQKYT